MRNIVLCALAFLCLVLPVALIGQSCKEGNLRPAAQRVKAIQSQLLAFRLNDEMGESVPSLLQAQLRAFKDAFAVLADAALRCTPPNANPKALQSTLSTLLNANKPAPKVVYYDPKKPPRLDQIYGSELQVKVTVPANAPQLVFVDFDFDIACGDDMMLLVYEKRNGAWQQDLRWQSGDYSAVDKAFGDFFEYVVLPPTDSDDWRVVVAHGSPWCTSRWSGFDLDILQPSSEVSAQKVLWHRALEYVRGEIKPVLKVVPDGFQIRVQTGMIDRDIMTRIGIYRYRVRGTEVERVQPIANNGRDFVDEWLQSPWDDAARWSASTTIESLKTTHAQIKASESSTAKSSPERTYGPVQSCSDSTAHFQVELDKEWVNDKGESTPGKPIYFQIQEGKNSFTMLSASSQPDAHCIGPDIMPKE